MNHTENRKGPLVTSLLRFIGQLTRPRYRADISPTSKLTPIADVLAQAGREPQQRA